ncbi:hypothetical protein ACWD3J_49645 [Streptomyces sp. NPDC002755]|uniref:hypothetical protein n=1 Tax=Streptomyces sp. NPDC002884 TaxID=3154544 RepID=UPI003318B987
MAADGKTGSDFVGTSLRDGIEVFGLVYQENGASNVNGAFKQRGRGLKRAFVTRVDSPEADDAFRRIAQAEWDWWAAEYTRTGSRQAEIAISIPVETRVELQKQMGYFTRAVEQFARNSFKSFDQFYGFGSAASVRPSPSTPVCPPTAAALAAYRAQQCIPAQQSEKNVNHR